jgi:tetratricopeptide (TPR) repeat protein
MKKIFFILLVLGFNYNYVQAQSVAELQSTAKTFMKQGDYTNAIVILNKCVEKEPKNTSVGKDLALSYFYSQNNIKALEIIKSVLESNDADDQCFLIAGNIYKYLEQPKESEKTFKKGVSKFPNSGPLYNELGEMQIANKDRDAIKNWEKGIKADPSYGKNYYNAARFYFFDKDFIWSTIYGEIFINMEPNNPKSAEIKRMLLDGYKLLFAENIAAKESKKNDFEKAYLTCLKKQEQIISYGITTESIFMLRTRFILDWYNTNSNPEYKLFDYQQQLLKNGLFGAYNQWVFGIAENVVAYQNWTKTNADEYKAFADFQKTRLFKMPLGQYYK